MKTNGSDEEERGGDRRAACTAIQCSAALRRAAARGERRRGARRAGGAAGRVVVRSCGQSSAVEKAAARWRIRSAVNGHREREEHEREHAGGAGVEVAGSRAL